MGLSEDVEQVAWQERELQLTRMDEQCAWEIGAAYGPWPRNEACRS